LASPEKRERWSRTAHPLHQFSDLHALEAAPPEIAEQPSLAHDSGKVRELRRPPFCHGAQERRGIEPFLIERLADRVLGEAARHSVPQQIAYQAGRAPPALEPRDGELAGKRRIVE
jgi:hypothetical protein